jgi:hypothetical protein
MDFLEQDKECCGASFEKEHISLFGLITLSMPLFYISTIFIILLFPFRFFSSISYDFFIRIHHANLKLIQTKNILSKTKCEWSGNLF